jgi:hypothetical protein
VLGFSFQQVRSACFLILPPREEGGWGGGRSFCTHNTALRQDDQIGRIWKI